MSTQTTASAAAAPVTPVTQPANAPGTESIVPVAPPNATPVKTANDIVHASGEDLSTRYGLKGLDEATVEAEPAAASPVVDPAAVTPPADGVTPAAETAAVITQPITPFQFYDEQGELEIPANVKIGFKAGGKEYKDLRLDEVVRMAQQAPMAEKHRQEAEQYRPLAEQAQQATQAYNQVLNELQQNNALYEQLLTNPALYQEAASQYQAQNSPEQRLARLQEQQRAERTQYQQQIQHGQLQQTIAAAQNYTATRIAPSVDALTTKYPSVDAGDVMAKFHELTAPLLSPSPSGGVWVPPNRLGELESSVLPQLDAWASEKSKRSTAATQAATSQANAQTKKAQLDAQLATRQLARPLTPVGSKPSPDVAPPPKIKSSSDAVEATLARARQQIQAQGAA